MTPVEFVLAMALMLLLSLILLSLILHLEAKRYGEDADTLKPILKWMRSQETTNNLTQDQIRLLSRVCGVEAQNAQPERGSPND